MKKLLIIALLFTSCLAQTLTPGNAYIISALSLNQSAEVSSGTYSLVPQVIVAEAGKDYIGNSTAFTGCWNGKLWSDGVEQGSCLTSVVNNLTEGGTDVALSAEQGKNLKQEIDELRQLINNMGSSSLDIDTIYPIGSIYMSVNSTSPATLFGGTWEQLKDRFLIGTGDSYSNGATGGEAEHTLTVNEMPNHSHTVGNTSTYVSGNSAWAKSAHTGDQHGFLQGVTTTSSSVGGGQAHNNMPPYLAVYMWKRTA